MVPSDKLSMELGKRGSVVFYTNYLSNHPKYHLVQAYKQDYFGEEFLLGAFAIRYSDNF